MPKYRLTRDHRVKKGPDRNIGRGWEVRPPKTPAVLFCQFYHRSLCHSEVERRAVQHVFERYVLRICQGDKSTRPDFFSLAVQEGIESAQADSCPTGPVRNSNRWDVKVRNARRISSLSIVRPYVSTEGGARNYRWLTGIMLILAIKLFSYTQH